MKKEPTTKTYDQLSPTQIINTYRPLVTVVIGRIVRNKLDAEELVHDVFIKVLEKLSKFNPEKGAFEGWLARIARNTAIDFLRSKDYKIWSTSTNAIPERSNRTVDPDYRLLLCRRFLSCAFVGLNEIQRKIIQLRFIENKGYEEIANILGLNIEHTRVIMHRAIEKLRSLASKK